MSKMPRFTAGGWTCSDGPSDYEHRIRSGDSIIADVVSTDDARLILASRDLFKSLSEVLAAYESDMRELGCDDFEQYGEIMRARAALAKASGA